MYSLSLVGLFVVVSHVSGSPVENKATLVENKATLVENKATAVENKGIPVANKDEADWLILKSPAPVVSATGSSPNFKNPTKEALVVALKGEDKGSCSNSDNNQCSYWCSAFNYRHGYCQYTSDDSSGHTIHCVCYN